MNFKNTIKMGWKTLGANILNKKAPLNVMLSLTNRCPSRCSYCNIPNRQQKELNTDEVFSLIEQISQMGCQRLGLWGGEPLVRDDIDEIINYAKAQEMFVTLDSNGFFIPRKIRELKNLDHLILGLDGEEKSHNLNKEPGSFQRVMQAIKTVKGKIPLWTITVLTRNNLDSIGFILNKAQEYGFLTTFQLLHHNDRLARNQEALLPSSKSYKRAIKTLILEKKKGAPIASSLKYLYHILNWPDYKTPTYPHKVNNLKCWAGLLYCNVDTDGSVYPCSLLIDKMKSLNFLDVGFKKAFESLTINSCQGCLASCFTEYNYLYSLDIGAIIEWLKAMRKTKELLCQKKEK